MQSVNLKDKRVIKCIKYTAELHKVKQQEVINIIQEKAMKKFKLTMTDTDVWSFHHSTNISLEKILGLDLDDTVLKRNSTDFVDDNIVDVVNDHISDGWSVVIFSNQKGVLKGKETIENIQERCKVIFKAFNGKCSFYIATGDDHYRKPSPDMFTVFCGEDNVEGVQKFIYVGDAAGRKGDFAMSDAYFLHNIETMYEFIDCTFYTPEEFFKIKSKKSDAIVKDFYSMLDLTEIVVMRQTFDTRIREILNVLKKKKKIAVFMIGYAASGKSTIARAIQNSISISILSQDDLGIPKCKKAVKDHVKQGKSFILDNTNLNPVKRAEYLEMIGDSYTTIAIVMTTNDNIEEDYAKDDKTTMFKLCVHLNEYRAYTQSVKRIPMVAYYTARKNSDLSELDSEFDKVMTMDMSLIDELVETPYYFNYDIK